MEKISLVTPQKIVPKTFQTRKVWEILIKLTEALEKSKEIKKIKIEIKIRNNIIFLL